MDILGDSNEPGLELVGFVKGVDFVKSFGKCLDGNVLGIILVFRSLELKAINIIPKGIQQKIKGFLVVLLRFCNRFVYFQVTGFEKRLLIKIYNCMKIKQTS